MLLRAGSDHWRLYGLALREAGRCLRIGGRQLLRLGTPRRRAPERLLIVPPDLRTSDATIANDIYAGYFVFGGRAVATGGRSPFSLEAPSRTWAEILYGFGWLRHLRAADTALARANARALVAEYLAHPPDPASRRAEVTARRVMTYLSQSPLILDGADHAFYHKPSCAPSGAICVWVGIGGSISAARRVRLNCAVAVSMPGSVSRIARPLAPGGSKPRHASSSAILPAWRAVRRNRKRHANLCSILP